MLSQGQEERLAFAESNGIKGRKIAQQDFTVERSKRTACSEVAAEPSVSQSHSQIAELSSSSCKDHGEAHNLRRDRDYLSHDILNITFRVKGNDLYSVPFAFQRRGHIANSQVFFQFCSYYCNFHKSNLIINLLNYKL